MCVKAIIFAHHNTFFTSFIRMNVSFMFWKYEASIWIVQDLAIQKQYWNIWKRKIREKFNFAFLVVVIDDEGKFQKKIKVKILKKYFKWKLSTTFDAGIIKKCKNSIKKSKEEEKNKIFWKYSKVFSLYVRFIHLFNTNVLLIPFFEKLKYSIVSFSSYIFYNWFSRFKLKLFCYINSWPPPSCIAYTLYTIFNSEYYAFTHFFLFF